MEKGIMKKVFGLMAVLLAAVFASSAFALQLNEDYTDAFIEIGTTVNFDYLIVNDGTSTQRLDLSAWTENYYITARTTKDYIELLPGAHERVAITVATKDALEEGIYSVWLKTENQNGTVTQIESKINAFEREEDSTGIIRFEVPHQNFCKDEAIEMKIKVINDSNALKEVLLIADSDEFLPVFEPSELIIPKNDYRHVGLKVKTFWYTVEGDYTIDVDARVDNEYITSRVSFKIVDCTEPGYEPNDNVVTSFYDYSVDAEKNELTQVRFNVRNLLDSKQTIRFATNKTFTIVQHDVTLLGGEDMDLVMAVRPVKRTSVGAHRVELYTYTNDMLADKDQVTVHVLPLNSLFVDLLENNFTIKGCTGRLVELYVRNTGDERLAVSVNAGPMPTGIDVAVNSPSFILDNGGSKTVSLYVSVSIEASDGLKEVPIEVSVGDLREERLLVFTALPRESFNPASPVTIYSYNSRVELIEGDSQVMSVQIQNDNATDFTGVVRVVYAGNALYEEEVTVKANSIDLVRVPFNTQGFAPGLYSLVLETEFEEVKDKRSITLEVKEKEAFMAGGQGSDTGSEGLGGLSGMVGLVTTETGLILIVIGLFILIGLVALASYFLGKGTISESAMAWRVEE